jgi:hypothetical protein
MCNKCTAWIKYRNFYYRTCPWAQQLLSYKGCISGTIHIIQNGTRGKRKAELMNKRMDWWMAKQLTVVFRQVCNIAKSDYRLRYGCPSTWNNSAPTGRIFMKFDIWGLFEYLLRKLKFHYNVTKVTGTLREDLCILMIISLKIVLRVVNILGKICRENKNAHFVLNRHFPKNLALYEIILKMEVLHFYCKSGYANALQY